MGFARWLFRSMVTDAAAHVRRYGTTDLVIAFWCAWATIGAWRVGWWVAFMYAAIARTNGVLSRSHRRA